MNLKFIAADTLQKIIVLVVLAIWSRTSARGSMEWSITLFSLSTLPNTLVMGIPLLKEIGARLLIAEQFPNTVGSIISFKVDSDIISLDGKEPLQTDAEAGDDRENVEIRKRRRKRRRKLIRRQVCQLMEIASPVSEAGIHVFRGGEHGNDHGGLAHQKDYDEYGRDEFHFGNRTVTNGDDREGHVLSKLGSSSTTELHPKIGAHAEMKPTAMPPASVMTRLILIMVWRKLLRNPNTYSSLIGLTWSLVSFKWDVQMPAIIARSIAILSDAGLEMAMFSLGLFMALQPRIIECGNTIAAFSMAVRFLMGPAVMAAASIAVGLKGVLLRIAIVQAALPQGIVPFVFAK
ncbi:hypothetical protein REPUB_Repub18cG0013200 [Reevesia pubescens]